MANAKKCDICGKFYIVPDPDADYLSWNESLNTSMIRILKRKPIDVRIDHEVIQFDACEDCRQDVLDYILSKSADAVKGE